MRPQWVHFFFGLAVSEDNLDMLIKFLAGSSDLTQFDDIKLMSPQHDNRVARLLIWWGERSKWRRSQNWQRKTEGVYCVAQNMNSANSVHSQKKRHHNLRMPVENSQIWKFWQLSFFAGLCGGIRRQQPRHWMTSSPWDKFHDLQHLSRAKFRHDKRNYRSPVGYH